MAKPVSIGDTFKHHTGDQEWTCVRLPDDPKPPFECERMRVRVIAYSMPDPSWHPTDFGVEEEWFRQRGFKSA